MLPQVLVPLRGQVGLELLQLLRGSARLIEYYFNRRLYFIDFRRTFFFIKYRFLFFVLGLLQRLPLRIQRFLGVLVTLLDGLRNPSGAEQKLQALIRFAEPQWALTPGQSVVLYESRVCLGGGVIR